MIRLLAAAGRGLLIGAFVLGIGLLLWYGTAGSEIAFFLPFLTGAATGLVLSLRRPGNALGWVFLAFGSIGFLFAGCTAAAAALVDSGAGQLDAIAVTALWLSWTLWLPVYALATVFPLLLFPEGLQSRRWKPVLWLAVLATSVFTLLIAFMPRLTAEDPVISVDNPFAPSWLGWLPADPENSLVGNIAFATLVGCTVVASVGLVLRFRRASGVERQQLRWFALAATLLVLTLGMPLPLGASVSTVANAFFPLALAFLPVACGIAIMRYGLYEIDRILSRTLSYTVVTGVVLATYVLVVASVSRLLPESNSTLAVAGATLAAAAAFRPVLRRVQDVVDRRFNRARFDAVHEVDAFAARLRDSVDADAAAADLSGVVQRTLQPAFVGMWTRGGSL